jgi:hypothetical protein
LSFTTTGPRLLPSATIPADFPAGLIPQHDRFVTAIEEMVSEKESKVIETLAPERLTCLRRVATIESVGPSTRIEGSKLSDREVEKLLSRMQTKSFAAATSRKWRATPTRWI